MDRKKKVGLLKDVLIGKRAIEELLPMRCEVVWLEPNDTEEKRAVKLKQIEANKDRANVITIVVSYE